MSDQTIDTTNDSLVGITGSEIVFLLPPPSRLTKAKALRLAAWLVVLAEEEDGEFARVLEAVKNT